MCFNEDDGSPNEFKLDWRMGAIDCGEKTYANYGETTDYFFGTAGRISQTHKTIEIQKNNPEFWKTMKTVVQVGMYDHNAHPAVLLFKDMKCESNSRRFMWNNKNAEGTKYDRGDLELQSARGTSDIEVRSVMAPPGYDLVLFWDDNWKGQKTVITGALEQGQKGSRKMKCQDVS